MPKNTYEKIINKKDPARWKQVPEMQKFGPSAIEYLVKALGDDDKWVRLLAADVLGDIGDVAAAKPLVEMLKDQDQDVRFIAAGALGKIPEQKSIESLEQICTSDNCFVRIAAEESIERLKNLK
ncbi:MAG: HEAT repeat domain-containing protein [Methanomicrobiaceae archaeon]|nr:HEAT repeat domain-containing protein [Methanomicrobiaceae archaeon]